MIPIKNVFYMLAYAFRALDRKAYSPLRNCKTITRSVSPPDVVS